MGVCVAASTRSNESTDEILMIEASITCDVNGEVGEAHDEKSSFLCFERTWSKENLLPRDKDRLELDEL